MWREYWHYLLDYYWYDLPTFRDVLTGLVFALIPGWVDVVIW